jgi:spore germination protein YaaH
MQQTAQEVATADVGDLPPARASLASPRVALSTTDRPKREVFGFGLASSLSDPTVGYTTWNFSLLSTVAFFGLHVQDDGTFAADSGMTVWNSSTLAALVSTAHANGVKVVLTIIQHDFSAGTPHMCSALAHATTTVANTVNEVRAKGVDGVNIDYEGLNGSCGTPDSSDARHAFFYFTGMVRKALPAGSYLSVDTYASSAADPLGFFDVPGIAPSVDSFFVMAYDLEYSNYARAPIRCSSFCLGPTAPLAGYYYNDTATAAQYANVVPASKVILGVPYYGRKSCVSSPSPNQVPTGPVTADTYLDATQEYQQPQVKAGSYAGHRDANDPAGQERWDTWFNTTLNCTRELYWDDVVSLGKKYDLVNRAGLRGVGLWNLNYGGGASELWALLNTYFECPVSIAVTANQTTTQFSLGISAGSCNVTSFDVQQYDSTFKQGWFDLPSVPASNGSATVVVDGYPNHTYQFQARAHSVAGFVGSWEAASTAVAGDATQSHPWKGLYVADAFGGIHPDDSAPLGTTASWPNWKIARAAHEQPSPNTPQSGFVLDGFGGMHPYGNGITSLNDRAYWRNWDIARDFAWLPSGTGGYVLDGYGGLHGFSINGNPLPPPTQGAAYWSGWDIARKVVIFSDGTGGYVLDAWGGVHSFGIGRAAPPQPTLGAYWHGWNIARGIVLIPGTHSGYVLDGYGGVHGFMPPGQSVPPGFTNGTYWKGFDIARGIWLLPSSTPAAPAGYVLDGYGGLHGLGSVPAISRYSYWPNRDIAIGVVGA